MKLNPWIAISLIALGLGSCTGGSGSNQTGQSPIATSPTPAVSASPNPQTAAPSPAASAQAKPPASPTTPTASQSKVKAGQFVSAEHPTSGSVRLVTKNGQSTLEFDNAFRTSESGPDLVVILHRSNDVVGSTVPPAYPIKEGDYVLIAPLKQYSGAQQYTIPANIDLSAYQSAAVWCRQFNATFGAAYLVTQ
jgi:hypothetical protein